MLNCCDFMMRSSEGVRFAACWLKRFMCLVARRAGTTSTIALSDYGEKSEFGKVGPSRHAGRHA